MRNLFSFRNLSIQRRLPLFICVLLLIVIITFGWISYISVKNEALKTGKERLISLSDQLSSMLSKSAQATLISTQATANQPVIIKSIESSDEKTKTEASDILRKLRLDTTWVLVELLNNSRQPVLRSTLDSLHAFTELDSLLAATKDSPEGVGKIYRIRDKMYYAVGVRVSENKIPVGYLLRWQKISASPQTLEQLSKLMGSQAKLYIGNDDGSLWTDMLKPVSLQHLKSNHVEQLIESSTPDKQKIIAYAKRIQSTRWLVSVEIPQLSVLESSRHFLKTIIIIGGVLLLVGILVAWLLSRNITKPLKKLTTATSAIANGNYSATVEVNQTDEVGKLASSFNAMIEQVSRARDRLEQKIVESAEMNEQLRDLSAYLQNVREDERIHIAREMHDELGQVLTGFKMDISWLKKKLADSNDPVVIEKVDYLLGVVDEAVKFVRKLASELRPSILDDLGLIAALEWHSQEFERRYNIKTRFNTETQDLSVSSIVATGLFRMYQESLTNVARHSNANKVDVNLRIINDEISLSIADNGKGFDVSKANKKTLGLLGMKERAAMIGGHLEIISIPGNGTTVIITVKHIVAEQAMIS